MPRRFQHVDDQAPHPELVTLAHVDIRTGWSTGASDGLGTGLRAQCTRRGDMVRMDMGVEDVAEGESELAQNRQVTMHPLPNRVDEHRFASRLVREKVGVRRAV